MSLFVRGGFVVACSYRYVVWVCTSCMCIQGQCLHEGHLTLGGVPPVCATSVNLLTGCQVRHTLLLKHSRHNITRCNVCLTWPLISALVVIRCGCVYVLP